MDAVDRRVSSLFIIPFILAIVGVFLFMALLNGQRDLTLLSLILFGIVAGAKLWTRWSLAGITCCVRIDKRRAFPDEKLFLKATVENRKWLPVWLEARAPVRGLSTAAAVTGEAGLLWYQKTRFRWELAAKRRGVYCIGPLGITSGDLFGFFPKRKALTETIEVVVYPRLVTIPSSMVPRRDFFGIPGAESPVQDPIYILGTRDYRQGQPAKHIHWKATARHHKLQEKIFEPSTQEKILLVVDVGPSAREETDEAFERLLEQAASVAVRLAERGCAVGLVTNGRMAGEGSAILSVTKSPRQMAVLLETLARLQREPARDLLATLRLHVRLPWGISCLYFALEKDESAQAAGEYFLQRRIPFLFFNPCPPSDSAESRMDGPLPTQADAELRAGEGPGG